MRRAAKADANQREIKKALEAIGCSVYYIKFPVDLLVGYRGKTTVLEVKNIHGKDLLTKAQQEFFREFRGAAYIVHGVDDAIKAVCQ